MHIYLIPAWYPQNAEDVTACFFREQAQALAKRGHLVTVIHISPLSCKYAFKGSWHQQKMWKDGNVRTFYHRIIIPVPGKLTILQDWYISRCYRIIIGRQIQADLEQGMIPPKLVHAHVSHSCAFYCLDACRRMRLPLVVTEHFSGLLLGTASGRDYYRVKKTILKADAFIFVGSCFQKRICRQLGINRETHVIPNMVEPKPFEEISRVSIHDSFTFLTACHLTADKSVDLIVQAFHSVFPKSSQTRLLIYGDGKEFANLQELTKSLEETDRVFFYGRYSRKDVPEVFSQADAFVLTSRVETFGIVYIEAMMCGLPCIGTSGQGAEDIIDSSNGLKVPYGDLDALGKAMRQMAERRSQYDPETIREQCIARFSADTVCSAIEKIYHEVLTKHGDTQKDHEENG